MSFDHRQGDAPPVGGPVEPGRGYLLLTPLPEPAQAGPEVEQPLVPVLVESAHPVDSYIVSRLICSSNRTQDLARLPESRSVAMPSSSRTLDRTTM